MRVRKVWVPVEGIDCVLSEVVVVGAVANPVDELCGLLGGARAE